MTQPSQCLDSIDAVSRRRDSRGGDELPSEYSVSYEDMG